MSFVILTEARHFSYARFLRGFLFSYWLNNRTPRHRTNLTGHREEKRLDTRYCNFVFLSAVRLIPCSVILTHCFSREKKKI